MEVVNEVKFQFLVMVSYEIWILFNGVLGMVDFLVGIELFLEQNEVFGILIDSGCSLLMIFNEIFDYFKVEVGELELENCVFDLGELIKGMFGFFYIKVVEKCFYYVVLLVNGWFMGDEMCLCQVLFNLVFNVIKFILFGGVELCVEFGEVGEDGMILLVFEIEDSGIGMLEEV